MRSSTSARTRRGNGSKKQAVGRGAVPAEVEVPARLAAEGAGAEVRLIPLVWRGMDRTVALVVASAIGGCWPRRRR